MDENCQKGATNCTVMERLIYTNSLPSKLNLKPFTRLPQLQFSSARFPSLLRLDSRTPKSLSCKCIHQFSSSGSTPSSRFSDDGHVGNSSTSEDLKDGSGSKPHLLNWVAETLSLQRKVLALFIFAFVSEFGNGYWIKLSSVELS